MKDPNKGVLLALAVALASAPLAWSSPQAETKGAVSKEPVTIRFQSWRFADPVSGDLYRRWMKEYQAENPLVTVQTEPVPYAERIQKYTTQVLAASPPDIVGMDSGNVVQFAGLGQVENLDSFYAKEGEAFKKGFTNAALALGEYKGALYALTHEVVTSHGLWYNIKYTKDAGLDPSAVVSSWSSYVQALKKVTTGERYGLPLRGKDVTGSVDAMLPYVMQKVGAIVSEDDVKTKLRSPEAKAVFKSYVELYTVQKVTPSPIEVDFTRQLEMFSQGKAVFMQQGSWLWSMVANANPAMKGNYLPVHIPIFEGGKPFVTVDGMSMMIGKGSRNAAQGWSIMKWITTDAKQLENWKTSGFLPGRAALVNNPDIQADPVASVYLGEMARSGVPRPRSVKTNEVFTAVHEQYQNALLQKKTPEQALEDAGRQIATEILK